MSAHLTNRWSVSANKSLSGASSAFACEIWECFCLDLNLRHIWWAKSDTTIKKIKALKTTLTMATTVGSHRSDRLDHTVTSVTATSGFIKDTNGSFCGNTAGEQLWMSTQNWLAVSWQHRAHVSRTRFWLWLNGAFLFVIEKLQWLHGYRCFISALRLLTYGDTDISEVSSASMSCLASAKFT